MQIRTSYLCEHINLQSWCTALWAFLGRLFLMNKSRPSHIRICLEHMFVLNDVFILTWQIRTCCLWREEFSTPWPVFDLSTHAQLAWKLSMRWLFLRVFVKGRIYFTDVKIRPFRYFWKPRDEHIPFSEQSQSILSFISPGAMLLLAHVWVA